MIALVSTLPATRLILVEDDPSIATSLILGLEAQGFTVRHADTAALALALLPVFEPHAAVLDLGLPDGDGLEVLQQWRQLRPELAVVVLTARTDLDSCLRSLELGAIDLVRKPFWMEELVARLRLRLRADHGRRVHWADACLDLDARTVAIGGETVHLTPQEWRLLAWLASHPDQAITRRALDQHALDGSEQASDRAVDTYVARLRRKLGAAGEAIETVWGLGYRFRPGPAR